MMLGSRSPAWTVGIASEGVGGLALSHGALGTLIAVAAAAQFGYMMLASAKVIRTLGIKHAILATSVQGVAMALLPVARLAPPAPRLMAVTLVYTVNACSNATSVTLSIAATNKCAGRNPATKGAVNGIATTIESIAKAIGPAAGAMLFAAALEVDGGASPLRGAGLFFLALATVLGGIYLAVGLALPKSLFGPPPRKTPSRRGGATAGASDDPAHLAPAAAAAPQEVELAAVEPTRPSDASARVSSDR